MEITLAESIPKKVIHRIEFIRSSIIPKSFPAIETSTIIYNAAANCVDHLLPARNREKFISYEDVLIVRL